MSNVLGIVIGVIVMIVGLILLGIWGSMFIAVFKGIFPILLILIGLGILIYQISEIKSKLEIKKEETPATEKR